MWRQAHDEPVDFAQGLRRLQTRGSADEPPVVRIMRPWCTAILGALAAAQADPATADRALTRLDSLGNLPPAVPHELVAAASFVAARLHEARGDLAGARAALARQVYLYGTYLTTRLREEGRLAALMGDRDAAIRAYQHYLTLRDGAEPSVSPEVEQVRAALARLVAEAR